MVNSFLIKSIAITSIIVIVGVLIISPAFFEDKDKAKILLSFELVSEENIDSWCVDLAKIISDDFPIVVFIPGKLAENHPSCIHSFGKKVDIGSKTYSNIELPSFDDYLEQLNEVQKGKETIDDIGNFDSKIFQAPGLKTDENIFSLLTKNGIEFDLSYSDHYNKFHEGQFLRFELITLDSKEVETTDFSKFEKDIPILIRFDSTVAINEVEYIIYNLKKEDIIFINPSDLMGRSLTLKK